MQTFRRLCFVSVLSVIILGCASIIPPTNESLVGVWGGRWDREAFARWKGEGPLSAELQEIATGLGEKLSGRLTSSEVEEGRRFFSTRVGRKVQAGLTTGLETTKRHMQRVATSDAAKDRLVELLRRALPGRKLPA